MSLENKIPIMTSDTSPSGKSSASLVQNNEERYKAYRAFNGILNDANNAWVANALSDVWIEYDFSDPIIINRYGIAPNVLNNKSEPKDFRFEAYNGASWDVLDIKTNITQWTSLSHTYFDVENKKQYTKYRIYIISNNGYSNYTSISNIEMYSIPISKSLIHNSQKQKYYSLSDNTLINMPDTSNKTIETYGIEAGKVIQLDVPFDRMNYVNNTPVISSSGKIFTQGITNANTLKITEVN